MAKKPNFFIVGAPRCGTTALCEYLKGHPEIYFSDLKEPHFFSKDLNRYPSIKEIDEYLELFKNSTDEKILGEASVWYLYSSLAAEEIYNFNRDSKILIMIRDPIDLIYSLHSFQYFNRREKIKSFEKAYFLQEKRKKGLSIPKNIDEPLFLQYSYIGKYSIHIEKFLNIFPQDQIRIVHFSNFIKDTKKVYLEILKYLDVKTFIPAEFKKINSNPIEKSYFINNMLHYIPRNFLLKIKTIKHFFGIDNPTILSYIARKNTKYTNRPPLDKDFYEHLRKEFFSDQQKLSQILLDRKHLLIKT